jgi:hypothetical protein
MGSLKSFRMKNVKTPDFNWDIVKRSLLNLKLVLDGPPKHFDDMTAYHYKFKHLSLILTADHQKQTYIISWEMMGPIGPGYTPQFRENTGTLDSEDNLIEEITAIVLSWQELGKMVYPTGW